MKFRIIAVDETEYWDAETLVDCNIATAFVLYLFKPNERTHICSLTPNSRVEAMENYYLPIDPDLPVDADDTPSSTTDYLGFIDITRRDPRFQKSIRSRTTSWDKAILEPVVYPDILFQWPAYQEEQRQKRLALNLPAIKLPLFDAAARKIFDAQALQLPTDPIYAQLVEADRRMQSQFKELNWK